MTSATTLLANAARNLLAASASAAVVLAVELLSVGWSKSTLRKFAAPSASLRRDLISHFLGTSGVLTLLGHAAALGSAIFAGRWLRQVSGAGALHSIPSQAAQIAILLLVFGFFDYWMHRWMHRFEWMWRIHEYHHSATEMSVFTAARDSFLVAPLGTFFRMLPVALLGIPAQYPYVAALITAHAMLIHSEVDWDYGWFGRWVLISPHDHLVHHSMEDRHAGKNFAFLLPIWDQAFGTFYAPRDTVTAIGSAGSLVNASGYAAGQVQTLAAVARALKR